MSTTITPEMNLIVPGVGTEAGPTYASDINADLSILDSHDHSSGKGVQISPAGININSALTINNNDLTNIRTSRFQVQNSTLSLPADVDCLYVTGVDLYYRDGNGNNVRITQSGNVAGSPGSISGLSSPASATYNSGTATFIWQSAALTPANMDAAAYIFRNLSASSKGLTLSPPAAMASDYSLTLPSLPASQKIMTLDAAGNMSAPYVVDNSTIEISTNTIQVKDLGITTAKLADGSVTRAKEAAVGQQISSSSGAFNTASTSYVSITNLSVSLTTTGRPVMLFLMSTITGGSTSTVSISNGSSNTVSAILKFSRGGSELSNFNFGTDGSGSFGAMSIPPGSFMLLDTPSAGTYTYTVEGRCNGAGQTLQVANVKLVAYEL